MKDKKNKFTCKNLVHSICKPSPILRQLCKTFKLTVWIRITCNWFWNYTYANIIVVDSYLRDRVSARRCMQLLIRLWMVLIEAKSKQSNVTQVMNAIEDACIRKVLLVVLFKIPHFFRLALIFMFRCNESIILKLSMLLSTNHLIILF